MGLLGVRAPGDSQKNTLLYYKFAFSSGLPASGSSLYFLEHSSTLFKTSLSCHRPAFQSLLVYLFNVLITGVGNLPQVRLRVWAPLPQSPSHHHVSGTLTVTSVAAKVRPSVLSFGVTMVSTVPPVQMLSEKLSREGNLSASWL